MASSSSANLALFTVLLMFTIVALAGMVKADAIEEVVAGEGGAATIELVRSKLLPQAGRCPRFSCQTHNDCYMRGCPACSSGGYCLNR